MFKIFRKNNPYLAKESFLDLFIKWGLRLTLYFTIPFGLGVIVGCAYMVLVIYK